MNFSGFLCQFVFVFWTAFVSLDFLSCFRFFQSHPHNFPAVTLYRFGSQPLLFQFFFVFQTVIRTVCYYRPEIFNSNITFWPSSPARLFWTESRSAFTFSFPFLCLFFLHYFCFSTFSSGGSGSVNLFADSATTGPDFSQLIYRYVQLSVELRLTSSSLLMCVMLRLTELFLPLSSHIYANKMIQ